MVVGGERPPLQQWAMRLRHIEVFNAVMLTGSVSAAARLINVTQPAVSRTLQHAELQLGITLFHRVRNRLVPTPEARALAPHVERVFADLDAVRRVAATLKAGAAANEVRVLSVLTLGHEVLPRALTLFRVKHSDVKVAFHTLHSSEIVAALALQEADVGFLFSAAAHPSLVHDAVGGAELVCVAPRGVLPARKREGLTLQDIAALPVIGLDTRDPLGMTLAQAWSDAGIGQHSSVSVQTYHTALALARHGHGVAIVNVEDPKDCAIVPLGKDSYPYACLVDAKAKRLYVVAFRRRLLHGWTSTNTSSGNRHRRDIECRLFCRADRARCN